MLGIWVLFRFVRTIIRSLADPEFRSLFALVAVLLAVGSLFYWRVEGWSLFNALYFSVITLTTVEYGDFSPHTVLGKAFTMTYIILGIGILLAFIETIASRSRDDVPRIRSTGGFRSRRSGSTSEAAIVVTGESGADTKEWVRVPQSRRTNWDRRCWNVVRWVKPASRTMARA